MSERPRTLGDYDAGGQTSLDGTDERTLETREECDQCPDDLMELPCWWHFLAAGDRFDEEYVARRREEVTG